MGGIVEDTAAFLADKGGQVARSALRRYGLPLDLFEDLTQEVLQRAWQAERKGDQIRNIEAFTVTLITRAALDMIRGHLRRPEGALQLVELYDEMAKQPDGAPEEIEATAVGHDQIAHLRRRLAPTLTATPAAAAGALVVLAIAMEGAKPAEDVPVPKGGVDGAEAVAWAGLFYAGGRDCFPTDHRPEDAAMRKRRSRALDRQRRLLQRVAAGLGDDAGGTSA